MSAAPETLDRQRRFHWREFFLALRLRDKERAAFHRRQAQMLQNHFSRRGKLFDHNEGRSGPWKPGGQKARRGKHSKAAKAESVALIRADDDHHPKRKLRRLDSAPGRAESECRSGTATLGSADRRGGRTASCCRRCGCTQYNACEDERLMDSCSWVEKDLCSACLTASEFVRWVRSGGQGKISLGR